MAAALPASPPPPSTSSVPNTYTQASSFPTSSRLMTDVAFNSANRDSAPIDDICRNLGFIPRSEKNTLAVPLMIAHLLWYSSASKTYSKFRNKHDASVDPHADLHKHERHASPGTTSCSHAHRDKRYAFTASNLAKIGCAFERCFFELRFFLTWDSCHLCVSVEEHYQSRVHKKLGDFHYYEDAFGRHQEGFVPKYSSFTTCEHGHQSTVASVGIPASDKSCDQPASKKATHSKSHAVCGSSAGKTDGATVQDAGSQSVKQRPSSMAPSAPSVKLAATTATKYASSSSPSSTSQTSTAKFGPPSANQTASTKPTATFTRRQQKQPEQVQTDPLLSDCRRFPGFAKSNADHRTCMSRDATLADVISELNRAVLAFGVRSNGDTLIWAELAGMVSLLNYTAALYVDFADGIESYMQNRFGNIFVDHYFRTVYCNRASYIEREEFSSEGCPDSKGSPDDRKTRRHTIEKSFTKMVPDVTDLRDGVQTVLFTFIWINYTEFQGYEAALSATLHVVIPLLETVIVRGARQLYLMQRALTAAQAISSINKVQTPVAYDLQWDLLDLSAGLQNLSGCDLPLFTSDCLTGSDKPDNKKGKRYRGGWCETVVTCPYSAHLYTAAVADITLRTLLQMHKAIQSGTFSKPPIKHKAIWCSEGCTYPSYEERCEGVIDGLCKRLLLIERKQHDWKPLLSKKKRVKKGKEKGEAGGGREEQEGKEMMLRDILSKRIDEFNTASTMLKGGTDFADLDLTAGEASMVANKNASNTQTSTCKSVTTTDTAPTDAPTITAMSQDATGFVGVSSASNALTGLWKSVQKKVSSELRKKPSAFPGKQAEWVAMMSGTFATSTEADFSKNPAYQAFRLALGELSSSNVLSCLTDAERDAWMDGRFEEHEAMGEFGGFVGDVGCEDRSRYG